MSNMLASPSMRMRNSVQLPFLMFGSLLILFTGLALSGIREVPFHPDESTQLYMSSDFDLLVSDPLAMVWNPTHENESRQKYRELDAPLTKYILGIGRTVAGLPALPVDWDWSASWQENQLNGALPGKALLYSGRLAITILLPFSFALIFFVGCKMGGPITGLIALFIMGTSALVLLHGRRAMAEGTLLFGVCLAMWGFGQAERFPWLAGLGMALAFNAKQSTLTLLPVGLLAVSWLTEPVRSKAKKIASNIVIYGLAFLVLTILVNPLLWNKPLEAIQASWLARSNLLNRQVTASQALAPGQVMSDVGQRAAVLIANLWIQPPSFYEVGNYHAQTAADEAEYLQNPLNSLFRGVGWGAIFLSLTILGIVLSMFTIIKYLPYKKNPPTRNRRIKIIVIVLLAGILQFSGLVAAVPLPYQRYAVPLIPFVSLWIGFGLQQSIQIPSRRINT